jgi:hypothetical protein
MNEHDHLNDLIRRSEHFLAEPPTDNDLIGEFSATVWAQRFVQRVTENPSIATDEGTMTAWFAGAIMAGYDHARVPA